MITHKKLLTGVILASLFTCIPYTAFAQEYVSNDGGFKIDVPEENFAVMAGNNFVISHSLKNGTHAIKQISKVGENSPIDFNNELKKIAADIKAKKDILAMPEYKYLSTDENRPVPAELEKAIGNKIGKSSYKITKINNIPALEVTNTTKIKTTVKLPGSQDSKIKIDELKKAYPGAKLSADGSTLEIEQTAYNNIYYVASNNHLYEISNGYTKSSQYAAHKKRIGLKTGDISFLEDFNLSAYKNMTKYFTNNISFFTPKPSNDLLQASDPIMNQQYSVPHDWIYGYFKGNTADTKFNIFGSFPYSNLEKLTSQIVKDNSIKPAMAGSPLNIDLNMDTFKLQNIVKFYDNLFISASFKTNSPIKQFDGLLQNPTLTKAVVDNFFAKTSEYMSKAPEINRVIKLSDIHHQIDVNPLNFLLTADFIYDANLPNDIQKLGEKGYDPWKSNETFNIKGYCQNRVYFDKEGNLNIMGYLTPDNKSTNKDIQNTFKNAITYKLAKYSDAQNKL